MANKNIISALNPNPVSLTIVVSDDDSKRKSIITKVVNDAPSTAIMSFMGHLAVASNASTIDDFEEALDNMDREQGKLMLRDYFHSVVKALVNGKSVIIDEELDSVSREMYVNLISTISIVAQQTSISAYLADDNFVTEEELIAEGFGFVFSENIGVSK